MRTEALIGAAIAAFFIFRSANAQEAAVDDTDEQLPDLVFEGNAFPYTSPDVLYEGQNLMTKHFSYMTQSGITILQFQNQILR